MKYLKYIFFLLIVLLAFWLGSHLQNSSVKNTSVQSAQNASLAKEWSCSMHPQIRQSKSGKCPICGMDLIPLKDVSDKTTGPSELKLSGAAEKLAEIETSPVERKFATVEIRMIGMIAFDEETMAFITARMPGRIDRLFANYTGIAVKKGDHIAEVYSPDLLLIQRELIESLNLIKTSKPDDEFAKRILNSVREKYRLWGFSEKQVQEIIDKGKVSDHLTITAPISGIVIEKGVNEGKYYEKGEKLFTIADLSKVWVNLEAYETDLAWIRYGQDVEFSAEAYPGKTFQGRIAFIKPFMNEKTRTIEVRLNAENHDGLLKPGMFVHATLRAKIAEHGKVINTSSLSGKWISPMHPEIVKDGPGVCDICGMPLVSAESLGFADANDKNFAPPLIIPASAPLITGKRAVVYVAVPGKKSVYEGREILLGPRAGDYYIVESGLKEGENVVVKGNFKIDSSLQILAKPSMMMPASGNTDENISGGKINVSTSASLPGEDIMQSYFSVHKALSEDSLVAAVKQAAILDKRYSSALSASKDLKTARENFVIISTGLYKEISAARKKIRMPVYKFFCPMAFDNKGASWLQDSDKIQNPYFGSVMSKCGELQETISGTE